MSPTGPAHLQAYPGATTCVVLGRMTAGSPLDLAAFRAVLWCVDDGGRGEPPLVAAGAPLLAVRVETAGALDAALGDFLRRDARHLPSVYVMADALEARAAAYQPSMAVLFAELEGQHRARVTRQQDGFRWQQHVIRNLPFYARRRVPALWRDALRGLPAVVCGAGPSLDVSGPKLAALAPGCVVFAADSALRALARHGVAADFAVSIDVAKLPEKCLPESHRPPRVILSAVSPPEWNDALPNGSAAYAASRQITTDWLAAAGVGRPPLTATETCGSTALDLARFLGCAPIHLFGMDLALSAKQRHAAGADRSIYAASGFVAEQAFPEVPGNYSPTVPTHALTDWRDLDARLAEWPPGLVFNVNDRGARLRNATLVHPDRLTSLPPADKARALAALSAPETADPVVLENALAPVRAAGQGIGAALPGLRAALTRGSPEAVIVGLRGLLADGNTGRALGAYALKLMPHLLPPTEGDIAFWQTQLDELTELSLLMQAVH